AEQLTWLARLSAEHGNLDAALRHTLAALPDLALGLVGALSWYWYLRGMRGEIAPLAAELSDRVAAAGEEYALCVLWAVNGGSGRTEHVERLREIMTTLPGPVRQPYLLVGWALFAGPPGPDSQPGPLLDWFTTQADPWLAGLARFGRAFGDWYADGSALDAAEQECVAALDLLASTGDRWATATALDALATFAEARGDLSRSLELTDQALAAMMALGAVEELADLRCRRADRLLGAGDLDAAGPDYALAVELAGRAGVPATRALAQAGLGEIARRRGDLPAARRLHEQALVGMASDWLNASARAHVLTGLGRLAESEGAPDRARALYREAIELARDSHTPALAAAAEDGLARLRSSP
ncbi:MAG TPA: tetratricopeptide repeat protein, partial [Micromonosporaceae bacterium]|nr:tetratricopeptide repeat protein [Micromonosporaceae bacterium]